MARIGATEARRLFEVRLLLDPPAVELAAARRTDDDITAMEAAMRRLLPVTRQGGEEALVAHRELHRAIYHASHNDILTRLLDDLWDKSDRYRRLGLEVGHDDESRARDFDEHRLRVDLVVAGDGARAARLMHQHIIGSVTPAAIALLDEREQAGTGSSTTVDDWAAAPCGRRVPGPDSGGGALAPWLRASASVRQCQAVGATRRATPCRLAATTRSVLG